MDQLFIQILNQSINAAYLMLAVLVVRLLAKKAPKWISCALWGLVALKLIMPFSFESALSLVPSKEPIPQNIEYAEKPHIETGIPIIQNAVNPAIENSLSPKTVENSVNPMQVVMFVCAYMWLIGIAFMLAYFGASCLAVKRRVALSRRLRDNIYIKDGIAGPFILGVVRPKIYIPAGLTEKEMDCVLEHEMSHIKRLDHLWKPLGYLILTVYWFHPLCWVSYILLCRDIELACDEKVTKDKDKEWKAMYCQTLLDCAISGGKQKKIITACPIAFGEAGIKERVKAVLNYKKPAFWVIFAALAASAVAAVCFATNPAKPQISSSVDDSSDRITDDVGSEKFGDVSGEEPISGEEEKKELPENAEENSPDVIRQNIADIDGNGEIEYVIYTGEHGIYPYLSFYFNGEAIFERDGSELTAADIGDLVAYEDVDRDNEKEIVLTLFPHVNSMPLMEFAVLKKKDGKWTPLEVYQGENISDNTFPVSVTKGERAYEVILSCKGLDKRISYDLEAFYQSWSDYWKEEENADDSSAKGIAAFADEVKNAVLGEECGSTCAWGVWDIELSAYDGHTCLVAQQGIQGYDRQDFWGDLYLYFDYDSGGKIRMLDMEFMPEK